MNDTVGRTTFNYSAQAQALQAEIILALIQQEMRDTTDTLYLFIDPVPFLHADGHPFRDALINHKPRSVKQPHKRIAVEDYPWLLTLDLAKEEDLALLRQSIVFALAEIHPEPLCRGAGRGLCGWLTSPHDGETVAKQLGATAIQTRMDRTQILMRYHDPAVHSLLWPQLFKFRQKRLMGVLSRWIFVDGDGQPVMRRHRADRNPHFTYELGLLPEQVAFIVNDIGIINRALRRYRRLRTDKARYPELYAASLVSAALARRQDHPAFSDEEQKEDLAFHILYNHPLIDCHPKIDYLLDVDTYPNGATWKARTESIPDSLWQQYAHDCEQQFTGENEKR